ncbi:MAG TPA: sialidase family protein, partial [Acidobacteriota bacterium]|nr:sialidase family protein [Acidobacteriota bacterium]
MHFVLLFLVMACVTMVQAAELVKERDVIIYQDDHFHSAFPSIVKLPSGELLCAFRRAPERRAYGEKGTSHTDPNSYLVLVRSTDNGRSWSERAELIFAHPFGGSQDPCMIRLQDGSILCASYG